MEFKFKIKVGETEIEINETANNQREFFEKISFFSGLPTKAPGGSTDLKIVYRKTKGGDEFYSVVSESEKKEFKFGIHKNSEKSLFPKGWGDLWQREGEEGGDEGGEQAPAPAASGAKPAFASKAPAAKAQAQEEAPQDEAPQQEEAVPTPAASAPAKSPLANVPKPAGNAAPATPAAPAKPAGASPQVNSVLNKYLKKG